MSDGSIKFSFDGGTMVFGSCNAGKKNIVPSLAESITKETGVTTIGATGNVWAEIVDGKETGNLTTSGTFIKTEMQYNVSFSDAGGNVVYSQILNSQAGVNAYSSGFNQDNAYTQNVTTTIVKTDLGNEIDPSSF